MRTGFRLATLPLLLLIVSVEGQSPDLRRADTATRSGPDQAPPGLRRLLPSGRFTGNVQRAVTDANQAAAQQDWPLLLQQTNLWFAQSPNVLAWDARTRRVAHLRQIGVDLRRLIPLNLRRDAARSQNALVEELISKAEEERDAAALRALLVKFPDHPLSGRVYDLLGLLAFDAGRPAEALGYWMPLVVDDLLGASAPSTLRLRVALALDAVGQSISGDEILRSVADRPLAIGDESRTLAEWRTLYSAARNRKRLSVAARGRILEGDESAEPPGFRPKWTFSFLENWVSPNTTDVRQRAEAQFRTLWKEWLVRRAEKDRSPAVALDAVVVGEQVILNIYGRLIGFDAAEGRFLWMSDADMYQPLWWLQEVRRTGSTGHVSDSDALFDTERLLLANDLWSAIGTDGRLLVVTEPTRVPLGAFDNYRGRFGTPVVSLLQNQMTAYQVGDEPDSQPEWVWSIPSDLNGTRKTFANHLFLSKPLVEGGVVYAASESEGLLHLSALAASSGRVLWSRPALNTPIPVMQTFGRATTAMKLLTHGGTLVCETRMGLLIGVDRATGELEWTRELRDLDTDLRYADADPFGTRGFLREPLVVGDVLLHMEGSSDRIIAVDLTTGGLLWSRDRRTPDTLLGKWESNTSRGDEYLAAVSEGTLLVVGSHYVRGLDVATGEERYVLATAAPSGVGCMAGALYLLPTRGGYVQPVDISAGRLLTSYAATAEVVAGVPTGAEAEFPEATLGNLLRVPGGVLSVSLTGLRLYPTLSDARESVRTQIASGNAPPSAGVFEAAYELASGRLDRSEELLVALPRAGLDADSVRVVDGLRRSASLVRISQAPLDKLSKLHANLLAQIVTPAERVRVTLPVMQRFADAGRFAEVVDLSDELFASSDLLPLFESAADPLMKRSARAEAWRLLARAASASPEPRDVTRSVRERLATIDPETMPLDELRALVERFAFRPEVAELRVTLAERLIAAGRLQAGEVELLRADATAKHLSADTRLSARIGVRRVRLLERAGLGLEAAALREAVLAEHAAIRLRSGVTVREALAEESLGGVVRLAIAQREPQPLVGVAGVDVGPRAEYDPGFTDCFDGPTGQVSLHRGFQLSVRGVASFYRSGRMESDLQLFDAQTSRKRGRVALPRRIATPSATASQTSTHIAVFPRRGGAFAVSLLESDRGAPLWSQQDGPGASSSRRQAVGPANSRSVLLYSEGTIVARDILTGELLWTRDGGEEETLPFRVFGDERGWVLIHDDFETYSILDSATGAELRRGTSDRLVSAEDRGDFTYEGLWFSRNFYVPRGDDVVTLIEVWDPFIDEVIYTAELGAPHFHRSENYLAFFSADARVTVYDLRKRAVAVSDSLTLEAAPGQAYNMPFEAVSVRVAHDAGRLYVDVRRAPNHDFFRPGGALIPRPVELRPLAASSFGGDVFCYDRDSGRRLWSRELPSRTIVLPEFLRLPVVLSYYKVRPSGREEIYKLEVRDANSGAVLARVDSLEAHKTLAIEYRPSEQLIRLRGRTSDVDIRLTVSPPDRIVRGLPVTHPRPR